MRRLAHTTLLACCLALLALATSAQDKEPVAQAGAQDTGSQDTGSQDTGSEGTGSEGTGELPAERRSGATAPVLTPRISNPDLFHKSLEAAVQALSQYRLSDDDEAQRRVNRIGYQMASRSGFDRFPFTFAVVDMPIPNAFALPAGQIFVTRGMLALGLDDQMLAALLGHEIAHVTEQHFLHMRRRATLLNVLTQLLTVGAIAAESSSDSEIYRGPGGVLTRDRSTTADLIQGAQATSLVMSELLLRSYSREHEDQSDEVGQRLAAATGFDPAGARDLMQRMRSMIPDSRAYGYWRTHPFFEERVRAADARAAALSTLEAPSDAAVDAYRSATQRLLLNAIDERMTKQPMLVEAVKRWALLAWPTGPDADRLRLEELHARRDLVLANKALARDYGALIVLYREEQEEVAALDPQSPLLDQLTQDLDAFREQLEELYPEAVTVLEGGIFETSFLECFASNYPESPRFQEVALHLGTAYSRLGRESDAVEQFLRVFRAGGDLGQRAAVGLRNLAPEVRELKALQQLADQEQDGELAGLAARRLEELAGTYKEVRNGAEYLVEYPQAPLAETIAKRLEQLADQLYQEMVLYQQIGDVAKAVDRANRILEYAPLSPAAERLGRQLEENDLFG